MHGEHESYDLLVEVKRPEKAARASEYETVWSLTSAQAVAINRYFRALNLMLQGKSSLSDVVPHRRHRNRAKS